MKYAVLSMDIEDWYHLNYFDRRACEPSHSALDGVQVYRDILAEQGIPSSFFVVGELVPSLKGLLRELTAGGHDLGVHGWDHSRPMTLTVERFAEDLWRAKQALEDVTGAPVHGYRAPCFSLDRDRLKCVRAAGLTYDSSRILFEGHPLYGTLDLHDFTALSPNIFRQDDFFEFQISSLPVGGRNVPVSGGGYIRIFPWFLMGRLISRYLDQNELYTLYIHPFELSCNYSFPLPDSTSYMNSLRFQWGRSSVHAKLASLIALLKSKGYRFTTFASLRHELLEK